MSSKQNLLGNFSKGLIFVVSAPAGTGKTTLIRMLKEEFSCIEESVSSTTRAPRAGEVNGKDYWFVSEEEFKESIANNEFLEHSEVYGKLYGIGKKQLQEKIDSGKHVFLVIDTQGAVQLQKRGIKAVYIFIEPPNMDALKERLSKRKTEDEAKQIERLSWAKKEMSHSSTYDYLIVNEDLNVAYSVLKSILIAEEHRIIK